MSELYRERDFCFYRAFVGSTSWFIYCTEKSVFLAIGSSIETHVIDSSAGFANKRPGVYNRVEEKCQRISKICRRSRSQRVTTCY